MFDKIIEKLTKRLTDLQSKGQFLFNIETIKNLSQIDAVIEDVLREEGYYEELSKYADEFKKAQKESIATYSSFGAVQTKVLDAYNNAAFENFYNKMAVGFTESNIKQPIKDALFQYISSSGRFKDFKGAITDILTTNQIETDTDKVAREYLTQYKRQQGVQLADEFNIQYFRYSGTEIDTTRPFCDARIGNIYTREEIKKWANEDWSGKIKGTNETNIFIVCGGWQCRHTLRPVSERVALKEGVNTYNEIEKKK
jgi:hypothetical protein